MLKTNKMQGDDLEQKKKSTLASPAQVLFFNHKSKIDTKAVREFLNDSNSTIRLRNKKGQLSFHFFLAGEEFPYRSLHVF